VNEAAERQWKKCTVTVNLEAATEGNLRLFTSPALLAELREVLARPHLAARLERQRSSLDQAMTLYAGLAGSVTPDAVPRVVPGDADDDHVIAAAVAARADLIVSGDRHLLTIGQHRGIRIVTPADAIMIIAAA
jgi:putative PIN family toxin of toxin-antitoxin system